MDPDNTEEEKEMNEETHSQVDKKDQDELSTTMEKVEDEIASSRPSGSKKKHSGKKKKIVEVPPEDKESAIPSDDGEQEEQTPRLKARPYSRWAKPGRKTKPVVQTATNQNKPKSGKKISKSGEKPKSKKKTQPKPTQLSDSTSEEAEDKPTNDVKQFSFPQYKILSGATVAAVKMRPQKLVIRRTIDEYDDSKHWAVGLFQPTTMSLKLRLLRLLLVWLFFRVLNKQTGWLSDKLRVGIMDEPTGPPPRPTQPGERYVKVFHESSPYPIHVRVRKPPGMGPNP